MRKEDITRLEAFEMEVWRKMEKITWTEHISNDVKTGRRRKIPVNDNKNQTTELDGTDNAGELSAAAARRSTKVDGGAHKLSAAAALRGRRTALVSWRKVRTRKQKRRDREP